MVDKSLPITSFRGDNWIFSNMYEHPITFNSLTYRNAEACFQALKCSSDEERLKFINIDGFTAKRLGKSIKIDVKKWDEIKDYMMFAVVQAKFKQCDAFRRKLMDTGGREIIEGNDHGDDYWGVCNKTKSGKNKLGKILMTIRDRCANESVFKNKRNEIYANTLDIPVDSVILGLKKGYYKYEPCANANTVAISEIALNPKTSKLLRVVAVYEKDENGAVIGTTIVEGNDIATVLVKLDDIAVEALYCNMMTMVRTTREGYEYFKSLNFKF